MKAEHGMKALGPAAMIVLGLMAIAAGSASAQTLPGASSPGTYTVNLTFLPATFDGSGGLISILVPGRNLKVECHSVHIEEGKINTSTDALGKFLLLGCLSLSLSSGGVLPCELTTLGDITLLFLILPILHGSTTFLLFEHHESTLIEYKSGTECPLPLKNPIIGAVTGQPAALEAINHLISFSPAIQLLTGDILRIGQFPSYLHGDITLSLTGAHSGQKFGIH